MSYLIFRDHPQIPPKKTFAWDVLNAQHRTVLGRISWYAPWRKYCYSPAGPQVLDANCMLEIVGFLQAENAKHKAIIADRKAEVV